MSQLSVLSRPKKLSAEFLAQYEDFPKHMNPLGTFVYYRTYSRWLPDLKRRETWKETCERAVEYNLALGNADTSEVEEYFNHMYNLDEFLSGRTAWVGGTPIAERFPMSNFNCAGTIIQKFDDFIDLFYLLMLGTGVGIRILKRDIAMLPKIRQDIELENKKYEPLPKDERMEGNSRLYVDKHIASITIADSKEGWVSALRLYFNVLTKKEYKHITKIRVNYNNIRPKGERLNTFGGTASGGESMVTMFTKIHEVLMTDKFAPKPANGFLRPIHALDIANIIGSLVVVGGVRRTSEVALIDPNDRETMEAKLHIVPGFNDHRYCSNNSIFYEEKPTRAQLAIHFMLLRKNGEPGFVNAYAARLRKPEFQLVNPCVEALLRDKQLCNLTSTNCMRFVRADGTLDINGLIRAVELNARAALRMSTVSLELPEWDKVNKEDPITGVSIMGYFDMLDAIGMSEEEGESILKLLNKVAHSAVEEYAKELGIKVPKLVCTVKPEGTQSKVAGGVSPGAGRNRAPFYIRRIRINAHDPLCKTVEALGWVVKNEVGQGIVGADGNITPVTTKVIEFPVKSTAKTTTLDVTALQQLNTYYRFQEFYTDHNTSITIEVNPDEWAEVEQNIWDNWDKVIGVSFIERGTTFYDLMPEEPITEEEYNKRVAEMADFDPEMLMLYERMMDNAGSDFEISADETCANGVCPIK